MLSATNTEHAQQAAGERAEAVAGADVVVLAVPYAALDDIARELSDVLTGKVVVEMSNPLSDTCTDLVTAGSSAAEQLQQRLPGASVVKAFNTIFAVRHASPTEGDAPLDAFVAGDDAEAKGKVGELAASLGYRFFDAGALRMARALEEMAFLNITPQRHQRLAMAKRLEARRSDEQQLIPAAWLGAVLEDGPFMGLSSAVCAAVEMAFDLGPVPDHLAAAVLADWGHPVDSALKAVEGVRCAGGNDIEALVVVVPTDLAGAHGSILALSNKPIAVGVGHLVAGATACRSLQATAGRARSEPDHETPR